MKKSNKLWILCISLLYFIVLANAQTINGNHNQIMNGFAPGIGNGPISATISNYLNNTSTITNQIECTTAICPAGEYLAIVSLTPTSTATLGSISLALSFTDAGGLQTVIAINGLVLTSTKPASVVYPFWNTGATNIMWSTTVTTVTGTYAYDVHVRLFKLG